MAKSRPQESTATQLLRSGCSIDQLVRDYGDFCLVVSARAVEPKEPILADEFRGDNSDLACARL